MTYIISIDNALLKIEAENLEDAINRLCAQWRLSEETSKTLYDHHFGQNLFDYYLEDYNVRITIQPLNHIMDV